MGPADQPHIYFPGDQPGLKAESESESQPGKLPAVCSASPGLHKVPATRAKRVKRPALHCALTPPCSHAPLTLPSAAARRPSPLHAPTRLLIPRCAPTAHGPASNRSMPQKPSRKAIIVSCFRNPRRPPCVACLASPCGVGAVPLQAWPSRGQRSTSPPPQYVFLLHAALRT